MREVKLLQQAMFAKSGEEFASSLTQYRDNENYNWKELRNMATIATYMNTDDFIVLDKLLRGVRYK